MVYKSSLISLLEKYAGHFSIHQGNIDHTNLGEMKLMLKSEVPIYYRFYRFPISEHKLVTLVSVIRDSNSSYASSIVLKPKKGRRYENVC